MNACRGQIGNQGFHRRGYFGSARDEATRTAPLTFDHALIFKDADGLPKDMTACAKSCADFLFGAYPVIEDRLALDFIFQQFPYLQGQAPFMRPASLSMMFAPSPSPPPRRSPLPNPP